MSREDTSASRPKLEHTKLDLSKGETPSEEVTHKKMMPWSLPEALKNSLVVPQHTSQTALIPVMVVAQCFGIFPVDGKLQSDFNRLRFSPRSFNSVFSLTVIVASCFLSGLPFVELWLRREVTFNLSRQVVFCMISTSYMICFFRLAKKWKAIMTIWSDFEHGIAKFQTVSVSRKIAVFTAVYLASSLGEHLLSYEYEPRCTFSWRTYLKRSRSTLFHITEFTVWKGVLAFIVNLFMTVSWNFTDLFLTTVSLALTSKFEQFNRELEYSTRKKSHNTAYWKMMRETYNHLALLTKFLDKTFSIFVFLSFINNLFFICFQLLDSLMRMHLLKKIYFFASFGHTLFRTCSVCLSAALIYERSKQPIKLLFSVPSEHYNIEVHRLLMQVLLDRQTLTGYNFFYITKGLLLTVAGTILTYEIFLVQLNNLKTDESEDAEYYFVDCSTLT